MAEEKNKDDSVSSHSLALVCTTLLVLILAYFTAPPVSSSSSRNNNNLVDAGLIQIDQSTGLHFSIQQKFLPVLNKQKLTLLGVGTRKKAILNVYSVGFYGDDKVIKDMNNRNKQDDSTSGDNIQQCQAILSSKGAKAVILTFVMGVGAERMAEALSNIQGVPQSTKKSFGDMIITGIGEDKLKKGDNMTLEWKAPDRTFVTVRGNLIGEVKDKALYQGLLNVYLGPNTVSPSLKQNIERQKKD